MVEEKIKFGIWSYDTYVLVESGIWLAKNMWFKENVSGKVRENSVSEK